MSWKDAGDLHCSELMTSLGWMPPLMYMKNERVQGQRGRGLYLSRPPRRSVCGCRHK